MKRIVIAGGGASGLAAAISAKRAFPEADVLIAERLDRVGKKILATGNGRCNLGSSDKSSAHYHGSVNASAILRAAPDTVDFFRSIGAR